MVSLASFPNELLIAILTQAAYVRSIKRALRLRLVCKRFADTATTAIFNSGILDREEMSDRICRAPNFWAEYLAYQTLKHVGQKSRDMKKVILVAQHICRHRLSSADRTCVTAGAVTDDELRECVLDLCKMLTILYNVTFSYESWLAAESADAVEGEEDVSSLEFGRHLLSAAAWMGEESLVVKLVGEGCNYWDYHLRPRFLHPLRAASYRGHVDIVRFLMVDDSGDAPHPYTRRCMIVNFAMLNSHMELLALTLDPTWHSGPVPPECIQTLQLSALISVGTLEPFVRLLESAKAHITNYKTKWIPHRIGVAVTAGQADIVRYLIEKEGAEDHKHDGNDVSLFQSYCPVELVKGRRLRQRDVTLLSRAARAGFVDLVRVFLDAGVKHDHAIEFAAMCGSRTIVRLLHEHGQNTDDAMQGALAMAVDREDTAMFNLLEGLGAKLDDDVRAAVVRKAQEEGLESMVEMLGKDGNAPYKGRT
ncbi:hypothetical protein P153DRAFT_428812 [Dothidotthia symphoricarpi CBS 119687]|uniref:Uncharacterized protein n=1 Tax=Dothidotthia symphoricarpi CBS 119687 TaxID=1392245 RepID=A0A6A6APF5_9PLEO|nr:uncharacterized protein P153DRAFT_428812 [Dothidotthia symphoricarpi CBS 119687]KAF2132767.1 hypothetical protein P153DRAFT_428812 [Dothidotthia symphoricarpi CBS 119687]